MKYPLYAIATLIIGVLVSVFTLSSSASAARSNTARTTLGYDVSYPQCGSSLPKDFAFAIVGVNGGLATTPNECLSSQLKWAQAANGSVLAQNRVQLYVNTGNPGEVKDRVQTSWPAKDTTVNGKICDGTNSWECSWVYGYQRAQHDVEGIFKPAATNAGVDTNPGTYTWWLDVETTNSWQEAGTSEAYANNRATLEGMVAYFNEAGISNIGIYSTNYQWNTIAGSVPAGSSLYSLPSWMAGARTARGAQDNCKNPPFVAGGSVVLSQYVSKGLDHNIFCK